MAEDYCGCEAKVELKGEIYVSQPQDFVISGSENLVYLLLRALYGLKKLSRAWHSLLHSFLISLSFQTFFADQSLYIYRKDSAVVLIVVYVDDTQITGNDDDRLETIVPSIETRFKVRIETKSDKNSWYLYH